MYQQRRLVINPLLLIFLLTMLIVWLLINQFLILALCSFILGSGWLFFVHKKQRWLFWFLILPLLSFIIQNYLFTAQTVIGQELKNQNLRVVKKASTYVIVQWHWQKFYLSVFQEDFIVGQVLKVNGLVTDLPRPNNSYNFDFAQYLTNENVYQGLKLTSFELVDSQNLRFLVFNWMAQQHFPNLITAFIFQQPTIPTIKSNLFTLNLSYLLNFSGLNFFVVSFCLNKIFYRFKSANYFKIPCHGFLIFYLYLVGFPLVLTRIIFGLVIKNLFSLRRIKVSNLNRNLILFQSLFLIDGKFFLKQMALYLIVAYSFFSQNQNRKTFNFWWTNCLKSVLIFIPLQILFQYRWNLTAPILSLILSPMIAAFYFLVLIFWWIPWLNEIWIFFEGTLNESLLLLKHFSFSWNFGSAPILIYLFYYLELFALCKQQKYHRVLWICLILSALLFLTYSKIFLPRESFFMLNVGNGSSFVYINKWKNLVIVYDCGSGPGFGTNNMADFLQKMGINHIDLLFISHFHEDHYNGLVNVQQIAQVKKIITNETKDFSWVIKGVTCLGWKVDNPGDDLNDTSLVVLIQTTRHNLLMLGDLTQKGEAKLMTNPTFVMAMQNHVIDLMQLGHHGSKNASSEAFLLLVNPKKIFISAGIKNHHQFPDIEVIQLLKRLHLTFYSTCQRTNWKFNLWNETFLNFK